MSPPEKIFLKPLKDLADDARALGFGMQWHDQEPSSLGFPGVFSVRLEPVTEPARDAIATAAPHLDTVDAIEAKTYYRPDDTYVDVVRSTAECALGMAKEALE